LVRRIERGLKASSKFSGLNAEKSSTYLKNRISGDTGTKRAHQKGKQWAQFRHKTGTLPAQNGRNFGEN